MSDVTGTDAASSGVPVAGGSAHVDEKNLPLEEVVDQKGLVTNTLETLARSGSTDQIRGYANEAIGEAKLDIGIAVGSPELALLGVAQKALGQVQVYIGVEKMAAEDDAVESGSARAIVEDSGENGLVDLGD